MQFVKITSAILKFSIVSFLKVTTNGFAKKIKKIKKENFTIDNSAEVAVTTSARDAKPPKRK